MSTVIVNTAEPVDYNSCDVPSSYSCGECGKSGVKLWREYSLFLEHLTLRCADCAARETDIDITQMNDDGQFPRGSCMSNQIGSLIPAVPTEENDTYWGYCSVPASGCNWWARLPLR